MKKFFQIALMLLVLIGYLPASGQSKTEKIRAEFQGKLMENSTAQGYEFLIAISPNDPSTNTSGSLFVYVSSTKPTDVEFQFGHNNGLIKKKRITKPYDVITFGTSTSELNMARDEVRMFEVPLNQTFRIVSSSNPISVYVMNSKSTTSDGYMAIPVSTWGTDYIHCGYYDKSEGTDAHGNYHGSGFLIVASENGTQVNIDLKGRGGEFSTTTSGRRPGDKMTVTLNKGQVYHVRGNGSTLGTFDLTGTRVKSDKPIGLISYHQRTCMPALLPNFASRDHLVEMIPPVSSWGKTYATIELNRRQPEKGDLFRIVASENMTKYTVEWYEKDSGELIERRSGRLDRSGDFVDVIDWMHAPGNLRSVRGVSLFKADKPILVMQYSYSADWDNDNNLDPFMVVTSAVEQFTKTTIFQTPGGQFNNNWFNLIAVGDPDDIENHNRLLESITIDDKPVYTSQPTFKQNRIPGTNLYWARMRMSPGPHYIKGDTKMGGYVYGYTSVDSYGWPAAMQINVIDVLDSLPPEIKYSGLCGEYEVNFTEVRHGKEGDDPLQTDLGVSEQPVLLDASYNFLDPMFEVPFTAYPPNTDKNFKLKVEDKSKDGLALLSIVDRAGNVALEKIEYFADKLGSDPTSLKFGEVRVNTSKDLDYIIKNIGLANVNITAVQLLRGNYYSLETLPSFPLTVNKNGSIPIKVRYSPKNESFSAVQLDVDSLIIFTDCLRFSFPIDGRGVLPKIEVSDWDAGTLLVDEEVCNNVGISVKNTGTQALTIDSYTWEVGSTTFYIKPPQEPTLPITLAPGQTVMFKTICFKPTSVGVFNATLRFNTNAESGDSLAILKGSSMQPGPMITNYNWFNRRVLDAHETGYDGYIVVSNSGTAPLKFLRAEIDDANDGTFSVVSYTPDFTQQGQIEVWPETETDPTKAKSVRINLKYKPIKEASITDMKIYPIFNQNDGIPKGTVYGILQGVSYLPKIEATGYEFTEPTLVGEQNATEGKVVIQSLSTTADLFIKEIKIVNETQDAINDFTFTQALPTNFVLPMGEALELPVTFKPTRTQLRNIRLDIYNDAFPGYDSIRITPINVFGYGYDQSFEATNVDFARNTRCDEPVRTFVVRNTGTSNAFAVNSIEVEDGYQDVFTIHSFTAGDSVYPQSENTYEIRFHPTARPGQIIDNDGKIKAKVTIETSIGSREIEVEAMSVWNQVTLKLPVLEGESKMTAGMTTTNRHMFPVEIELTQDAGHIGNWDEVKIDEFTVEIKYNPTWMKYNGSVTAGDALSNWTLNAEEKIHNAKEATLIVKGKGGLPINKNGKLFNPNFLILFSDSTKITPQFGEVSFGSRDECIASIEVPGRIELQHCVQDLRNVIINKNNFNMIPISPNPVTTGSVNLNFSIGLDNVYTKIDIVNSMGEVVRTLQDGEMRSGSYSATIVTSELGSGVYFINMVSGPFQQREKLVISK